MADKTFTSLVDAAILTKGGKLLIDTGETPLDIKEMSTRVVDDTKYEALICKSEPRLWCRGINEGVESVTGEWEMKQFDTYLVSTMINIDKGLILRTSKSMPQLYSRFSKNVIDGLTKTVSAINFYGTKIDPKGWQGFMQLISPYMTMSANTSKYNETTLSDETTGEALQKTAAKDNSGSSVYMVCMGEKYVQQIVGNGSPVSFSTEYDSIIDDAKGKKVPCKTRDMNAFFGLSAAHPQAIGRIKNISDENPLTDDLIADAVQMMPTGAQFVLFLNKKTLAGLRKQRSAALTYNSNGSGSQGTFAPIPTESNTYKIVVADSILNDESDASLKLLASKVKFERERISGTVQK